MNDIIFREYDIRGKVGHELVVDDVYDLTRAIAYFMHTKNKDIKTIAVGMDGRTHSPVIKEHVCRALIDSGINVEFIGLCPSPALYFAVHTRPVDAGLMITASHNPKEYNGIKMCLGSASVWGKEIQIIKSLFREHAHIDAHHKGSYTENLIVPEYITWLADHFSHLKKAPIKAVVDLGNGAAGAAVPQLVRIMSWEHVQLLCEEVDGNYPNHEADPTVLANMQDVKQVLQNSDATVGVGIDGDADRMTPMTKDGRLISGDQLLALFARYIAQEHPGTHVVFDVKASAALISDLKKHGLIPHMSPSGHAIIKNEMRAKHALLAGELSCHFFFADRYFGYDDAIYAMMRLFEMLLASGKTLEELVDALPRMFSTREYRIPYNPADKDALLRDVRTTFEKHANAEIIAIDGIRVTWPYGWGLVRASNTQPVVSLRFEAMSEHDLKRVKDDFMQVLGKYLGGESACAKQLQDN